MARIAYGTGTDNVKALKFDKPIEHFEYKYDLTEWLLNEEQPENGIVVENHRITITKFKPNVWLIKSNYSGLNQESYLEKFYNVEWKINGIVENSSLFSYYTYNPYGDTRTTYNAVGIVISPINSSNSLFSMWYPWDMNIPNGYFKSVIGAINYGYNANGTFKLYNFGCYNGNFNQVALALFTNNDTDENGYITLETPIVLSLTNISEEAIDPTTIEGFKATLGSINVYDKPKTFSNTFIDYSIANTGISEYNNVYYYSENNTFPALTGANVYFKCDGGNWPNKYDKLRYPYPTDLNEKIDEGFPVKFVFTQYDKDENGFWNSLYNKMSTTEITDGYWGSFLFTGSNVPKMKLVFNPKKGVHIGGSSIVNMQNAVLDNCFDGCHNLSETTLVRKGDENVFNTLNEVFRNCINLSTLKFESQKSDGSASTEPWRVGELSGTFAACGKLTEWPTNIVISNTQYDNGAANDYCAQIQYAFEASGLYTIGSGEEFNVGAAIQSFRNCPNLVTVNSVLNMRYVHPDYSYQVDDMFLNTKIETISLKNINHNSWNFDGVTTDRSSRYIGDCSSFNQYSVNYLFDNLYDLTSNALEENILKRKPTIARFNSWTKNGSATINSDTKVTFSGNGSITINNASAGNFFKFTVSNLNGTLTLTGGNESKTITENGSYYVYLTGTTCTLSSTSNAVIDYITTWDGAVSTVTLSSLYCPSAWDDETTGRYISNEMIGIAESRGWWVFIGGIRRPYVPETGYQVIVNVSNTNLTYNGSTTFNVKLNRTVGGVTTTTDITSTATLTTGGSITVNQNNGTITGNNSSNYATTGAIKASYTPEGETSAVESTVVTINVTAKPMYSLTVTATPSTITSDGSSTLRAVYNTIIEGQTASTQTVTTSTTFSITSGGSYATINGNILTGNNSTSSIQSVVVRGTYNSVTGNTTVTVQAQAIEYTVHISPWNFTGLTSDSGSDYATITTTGGQNWYFKSSEIPDWITITPMTGTNGDSIIIEYEANTGTSTRNSGNIYAYGSQSGSDYLVLSQYGSVEPTLVSIEVEIEGEPNKIPAAGGSINYSNAGLEYTVYAVYSDDTRVDVTDNASLSSNTVFASNLGTTEKNETYIGNLYVVATYEGITSPSSGAYEGIYQEANVCTVTTTTGKTDEGTVRKRENIRTEYSIDFNPSSISVSSDGGTTSIQVNAISTTTGDIYKYETWYETSTPHSAYTSGAESDGPTTTATTQTTGDTGEIVDTFTDTATTATTVTEKPSWCTSVSNTTDSNPNSTITYSSNSGSERIGDIKYQIRNHSYEYSSITITQESGSVTPSVTSITIVINSVPDIPASGGSVDCDDAEYTVTAHYSDGTTRDLTSSEYTIIDCSGVTAGSKGTTVSDQTVVDSLKVKVEYEGKTATASKIVKQQANEVEETWEITGETGTIISETPQHIDGIKTYSISVEPTAITVPSESGIITVDVVGIETAPYTAFTTVVTEYPRYSVSAYTSTESGQTSLTPIQQTSQTGYTESATTANTTCELSSIVSDGFIDGSVYIGDNQWNIQYTNNPSFSERTGTVTYAVQQHSSTTGTITLTQSGKTGPTGREVTFNTALGQFENNGAGGQRPMTIKQMYCKCSYNNNQIWEAEFTDTENGLTQGENTYYPVDEHWTVNHGFDNNKFVAFVDYGVTEVQLLIEFLRITGNSGETGADYSTTVSVNLSDSDTDVSISLPNVEWRN